MPCKEDGRRYAYIKVNPVKKKETMAYIMNTVREYLPATIDYELHDLNEIISNISGIENTLFKLKTLFSAISVIVSLFGVYSSIVLTTERRRREVAIRKINGATLWIIIKMFLRTYLYILVAAVIPAFAVVYIAINKWLETYAYRISVSWTAFAVIFLTMVCLLILTVIYQLLKTARLNPAEEIKK
jgi:ABC-type antimicrobial peptide transport system permease subunit